MGKTHKRPKDQEPEDIEREERLLERIAKRLPVPLPNRSHFHSPKKRQYMRENKTTREYLEESDEEEMV